MTPIADFKSSDDALFIIDLSWWIHRAFHIGGADGMTAQVVGWLVALLVEQDPKFLCVGLESAGPTFRHRIMPAYKANRIAKGEEFYRQSDRLLEIVAHHRIPAYWAEGWEADDAIAAATKSAREDGLRVAIVTADKDLHQLVTDEEPRVVIWDGKDREARDEGAVLEKFGVLPTQLGDWLALVGDASDNVPGVAGIGPKKAAALLEQFGTLEHALEAAERRDASLPAKIAEALRGLGAVTARLSRKLIELDAEAPIGWSIEDAALGGYDVPAIRRVYQEFGFTRLAESVQSSPKPAAMF